MIQRAPKYTLFPYTTLFRSNRFKMGFVEPVLYAFAGAIWIARTADRAHWTSDQWLGTVLDRKSTRLNSSHSQISYAVFCLKKKISEKKFELWQEIKV